MDYQPDDKLYSVHASALSPLLVGKSIESIDTHQDTVRLTDGTVLAFDGGGDCCARFSAQLKESNLTENVITAVREVDSGNKDEDYLFTIAVFAVNQEVMSVEVTGDEGSGYYGSSFDLRVYKPKTIESFLSN